MINCWRSVVQYWTNSYESICHPDHYLWSHENLIYLHKCCCNTVQFYQLSISGYDVWWAYLFLGNTPTRFMCTLKHSTQFDGFVQERHISVGLAVELCLSCMNLSTMNGQQAQRKFLRKHENSFASYMIHQHLQGVGSWRRSLWKSRS